MLTRCLAAYAVYYMTECPEQDAASAVVDGSDDNGIDAVYYSPTQKQLIIVQSKWIQKGTGEPDSSEIGKFCQGIRDLFNMNFDRFNDKLRKKQTTIEHALGEFDTRYILVLIDTGDSGLAEHGQRQVDDIVKELNNAGEGSSEELVSFVRMNQSKVHSSLALSMGAAPIELEIGLSQWGKLVEPHGAFFGMIAAAEIAAWWGDYGRRLFEKNIRQVLGSTDVNEEIRHCLKNTPERFWYYNNGITLVADQIDKSMIGGNSRETGTFKLTGAQIINGAQTVSSIGRFAEEAEGKLENAWVSARLISLDNTPSEFGAQVTRANNRQNRIENRDFVSQDREQVRIKTELSIEGVDYNIVRSDTFKANNKSFDLQEATTALACATGEPSMAVQAKREIGKFYEELGKSIYKKLFNPSTTGIYVWNCVRVARMVDGWLQQQISHLEKRSGRKYGLMVHGNRILTLLVFSKMSLDSKVKTVDFTPDEESIHSTLSDLLNSVYACLEEHYPDSLMGTLFKNASKCKDIVERCTITPSETT
nr:putative abortive infection phage resistance protein [bacterium]